MLLLAAWVLPAPLREAAADERFALEVLRLEAAELRLAEEDPAALLREELADLWHSELVYKEQERYIRLLFQLAERWKERFRTFKKERNLLDYNDMEKYLRDLH